MMITCINAKKDSHAYTSVALQYAVRAKHIKNSAVYLFLFLTVL
jgi:hypothetical protein